MCSKSCRHSHAVQTVWRLFETVSLSQVIINLTVLDPGVRSLAPRGDLPHGDSKRPLRDGGEERGEALRRCYGSVLWIRTSQTLAMERNTAMFVEAFWTSYFMRNLLRNVLPFNTFTCAWKPGPLVHARSDIISCYRLISVTDVGQDMYRLLI